MANKDSWMGNSVSKKAIREHITPHKISVVILIQEYCNIKAEALRRANIKPEDDIKEVAKKLPEPGFRRDFCMLILHLIQCPDMDFIELLNFLECGKYSLIPGLFDNFMKEINGFTQKEVGSIMDVILNLGQLMIDPINAAPLVNKSSPLGVYLRRIMLYFDKLNFSQTVSLYRGFQYYVMVGKQAWANKAKSDNIPPDLSTAGVSTSLPVPPPSGNVSESVTTPHESAMESVVMELSSVIEPVEPSSPAPLVPEINNSAMEPLIYIPMLDVPSTSASAREADSVVMELSSVTEPVLPPPCALDTEPDRFNIELSSVANPVLPPRCTRVMDMENVNMELSFVAEPMTSSNPTFAREMDSLNMDLSSVAEPVVPPPCPLVREMESMKLDNASVMEEVPALWSRRQAELFIAHQTAFLQSSEKSALPPPQLQDVIRQVLKANPDHFEAHYLSYLNCLRVNELGGAIDSLYHFFDRNTATSQDKEAKGYRYAALNLAILHAKFGHKSEALTALKEAIWLAHEVNDNVCLQHAQAWLYVLTDENKEILMERSISKCSDLNLNYLTSLGLLSFAQFAGTTGGKPSLVFEVLMRSDVLNCQFSMMDMMTHSFAHKSALWNLYGKSEMASLTSQLLLHQNSYETSHGLNSFNGEATCQAICNIALRLLDLGDYELTMLVIEHARESFPNSSTWQLSEQLLHFTHSLYKGEWQVCHSAIKQIATLDKWEALIREGQLLLAKGDNAGAVASLTTVLDGGPSLCPSMRVRALMLAARGSQAAAASILTTALSIANYHYLDYQTAKISMQLAEFQLEMNLASQALKLMDHILLTVLAHGGYFDQGAALLLFIKCKVASVATAEAELRTKFITDAIHALDKVRENFQLVEAYTKVKETVYLQCLLAHELDLFEERNKFAYEFRQLNEEYPTTIYI